MARKLRDSVVVITGASSGIGRAAAVRFGREGAAVVLAARREDALQEVKMEVESHGGRALVVPTDTSDEEQVHALARTAIESFGRIDVWVNNAAVSLFGRFEETPAHLWRQVIETNLFGYVSGARAVLPIFREQGSGVLIMNDSVIGLTGSPFISAYATSKFAIRGFATSLRQELIDTDIHVCSLMPASIDTPIFQHAGNLTGRAVKALDPVTPVEEVAEAMISLAKRPQRELLVGKQAHMMSMRTRLMPASGERLTARQIQKNHFQERPAPPTEGNVLAPMQRFTGERGGWLLAKPKQKSTVQKLALVAVAFFAWRALRPRLA